MYASDCVMHASYGRCSYMRWRTCDGLFMRIRRVDLAYLLRSGVERVCVPLFFMLSRVLTLPSKRFLFSFTVSRFWQIVLVHSILWS